MRLLITLLLFCYLAHAQTFSGSIALGGPVSSAGSSNLVAQYNFSDGSGNFVTNSAAFPATSPLGTSITGLPSQGFALPPWAKGTGITITDGYSASPLGTLTATRIQSTATSNYVYVTQPYSNGQTYTLSVWVISNTGSTQSIHLENCGMTSSAMTVPLVWTKLSYTCTAGGTSGNLAPVWNSDANVLDISIWGAQLDHAGSAAATIPQQGQLVSQVSALGNTAAPDWESWGVRTDGTTQWFTSLFDYPASLPYTTTYVAFRVNGAFGTIAPLLSPFVTSFGSYPTQFEIWPISGQAGAGAFTFGFSGARVSNFLDTFNDGDWHVMVCEYDGAEMLIYVDGNVVVYQATTGLSPITINGLSFSAWNKNNQWAGDLGYASVYSVAHTPAQVIANTAAIQAIMTARGQTMPQPNPYVIFEGSTFTFNDSNGLYQNGYVYLAAHSVSPSAPFMQPGMFASDAATMAIVSSRGVAVDTAFAVSGASQKVLVLWIGEDDNGSGTLFASMKSYALARKAATPGLKIVVLTLTPRTPGGTWYSGVNSQILGDTSWYDAVADVGGTSTLGCNTCWMNTAYYPDNLHPSTAAAHAIIGPLVAAAIQSVL